MLNEKLLNILRKLPPKLFKKNLQRATLSSFHNGSLSSEKMYKALSPYYPNFELSPKDIRKIYTKIFPKKAFNAKSLERYSNALLKTTESFLLFLRLENDNFLHEKLVNKAFLQDDLFDLFKKSQAKQHKLLEEREQKEADYWLEKTELYDALYAHPKHEKYDANDETHTKINESSNRFYAYYKINSSKILQEHMLRTKTAYEDILLNEIEVDLSK